MSYALDTNILLYASDETSEFHGSARRFLQICAERDELLCLPWPMVMGYLRIATHAAIFDRPLSHAEALSNVESLVTLPHARLIHENEDSFRFYGQLAAQHPLRGNLVPDAHIACILRANGVRRFYSRDRDFLRFDFLDVKDPLKAY